MQQQLSTKKPRKKINCPSTYYKSNGCQKKPKRALSLDKCPKQIYGKDGCRLSVKCKDDERKCPRPKRPCCPEEHFCISKFSSKTGKDGKKCLSQCQGQAPPGQVRCPGAYDVNGCELPPTYVKRESVRTCPPSLNGCQQKECRDGMILCTTKGPCPRKYCRKPTKSRDKNGNLCPTLCLIPTPTGQKMCSSYNENGCPKKTFTPRDQDCPPHKFTRQGQPIDRA